MGRKWNPKQYERHGGFVSDYAREVVEILNPQPGERILDLGCGDGRLSEFIETFDCRLVAIDSSPGPRARDRGRIVPAKPVAEPAADGDTSAPSCTHRLGWAALLARVFSSDLSACATCGGRLRIVAALTDPASIRTYLEGIGLPAVPPPRAPPQPQFEFAA